MTALRFGLFALGLAACVAPSTGHAVDLALDPYVEYNAGLTLMRNQNLTRANPPGLSGRVESKPGFNVGGAIGTKFLQHFRTEINVGYRQNDVDKIAIQAGANDGDGTFSMLHVLTNAYAEYDFNVGVIPYFGLGIGYGLIALDANNETNTLQIDSDDNAFIWNVMVGGSIPLHNPRNPERPTTVFNFGYRYLQSEDLNFRARLNTIPSGPTGPIARQVDSEYDAHELVFGLRLFF
jgi:opacity protein-like surface antigen